MEDATKTESAEERRARLIEEARQLKAPIDQNWTTDQIEAAVAKKRPKAAPAAPSAEVLALRAENDALKASLDAANQAIATADAEIPALRARVNALSAENLEQFEKLGKAELDLFELKQKAAGVADNPQPSEDFAPRREGDEDGKLEPKAAAKPIASGAKEVRCTVTKHGDGHLFTGNGDERHRWKDVLILPADVAQAQEAKGFVEIG